MKKAFPIVGLLTLLLASCGNTPVTTSPSLQTEQTSSSQSSARVVLSEQPGITLFAAKGDGFGFSDHRLHVAISGREYLSQLANGTDRMVMGAALSNNPSQAYVLMRQTINGSSHDSIVLYNMQSDKIIRTISDLAKQNITGTGYNSLILQGNKLRFVADIGYTSGELEIDLNCLNSCEVQKLPANEANDFHHFLKQKLSTANQVLSAQQTSAVYLNWPKGVSGHHFPGSNYHTGNDA